MGTFSGSRTVFVPSIWLDLKLLGYLPDAVRRSKLFTGMRGAVGCLCAAREAKLRERAATESPSPVASSTLVAVVSAAAQRNQASKYLHVGGGRRVVCVLSKHTCGCPHS